MAVTSYWSRLYTHAEIFRLTNPIHCGMKKSLLVFCKSSVAIFQESVEKRGVGRILNPCRSTRSRMPASTTTLPFASTNFRHTVSTTFQCRFSTNLRYGLSTKFQHNLPIKFRDGRDGLTSRRSVAKVESVLRPPSFGSRAAYDPSALALPATNN
jgi:hypothetical protein